MPTTSHIHHHGKHSKAAFTSSSQTNMGAVNMNGNVSPVIDPKMTYKNSAAAAPKNVAPAVEHAAAEAAPAAAKTGGEVFDSTLSTASNALNMAAMVPMVGQFAGAGVAGGLKMVGAKKAGASVGGFMETMGKGTFADIGEHTGLRKIVGGIAQPIANVTASVVAPISDATGFSSWRSAANKHTANKHRDRMQSLAETINNDHLAGAPASLQPHLQEMHATAMSAHAQGHVDVAHYERFNAAKASYDAANRELGRDGASKALKKTVGKLESKLGNAHDHHLFAEGWKDVKGSVKNAPATFGNTSAMHGIMNGAWIIGSAISAVTDAREFTRNVGSLKKMHADLTGTDPANVSTFKVLFSGNVPAPVRTARSNIMKHLAVSEAGDAVSMAVNIKGARSRHWGAGASTLAYMIPDQATSAINSFIGDSSLQMYAALSEAHAKKQPIPADYYAAFLAAASPDIAIRGGASSPFAKALAQKYSEASTSPTQILKDVESGKILADIHAIIKENEAAPKAAVSTSPAISHTARLKGDKSLAAQPVVGEHTKSVVQSNAVSAEQSIV